MAPPSAISPAAPSARAETHLTLSLRTYALDVALVTLAGAALRWYRLTDAGLWLDEALAMSTVTQPLAGVLRDVATQDVHPPLFFVLESAVAALWPTEAGLRALPWLFGVLSIPVAAWVAADLSGRRAGLAAAALAAASAPLVAFSHDGRMYTLLALLELAAAGCLIRALRTGQRRWFLGYALASVLGLYTHNVGGLFLAAQAVAGLCYPGRRRALLGATALALVLYLPWVPVALAQTQRFAEAGGWYGSAPPWWFPALTLVNLLAGTELRDGILSARFAAEHPYVLGGMAALLGVGWTRLSRRPEARLVLVGTLLIPPGLALLLSQHTRVYMDKTFLAGALLLVVLMAASFGRPTLRTTASLAGPLFAGGLVLAGQLWGVALNSTTPRESYPDLVAELTRQVQPGDHVYAAPWFLSRPLRYYLARADSPIPVFEIRPSYPEGLPEPAERVWVVSGVWSDDPGVMAADAWRDRAGFTRTWQGRFPDDGLLLTLYTRPGT